MKVSIIVPCYNELNTIEEIVLRLLKYVKYDKEIIIVDDGSSDGTEDIIRNKLSSQVSKLIQNDKNYGKGYSVRKGIQAATGDIIVIQDADLEYHPSDLNKLIEPIKNGFADVVYGSRFISTEERRVLNYWHSVGNYFLTFLSNVFTNINLTDMEVGYKVFKSEILKNIDLKENRFGFEPEITAKISNKNVRIFEVGIKYFGRNYSEGKKINWKDGISAIRCIFQYNLFTK
jgi:glycosyltransferase involved in cell wall biosynthesis